MSHLTNSYGQEMPSLLWDTKLYHLVYKTSLISPYTEPAESISHPQITTYSTSSCLFIGVPSRPFHSDFQNKILKEFLTNVESISPALISAPRISSEYKLLHSSLHNFLELPEYFTRLKCKYYPQHFVLTDFMRFPYGKRPSFTNLQTLMVMFLQRKMEETVMQN